MWKGKPIALLLIILYICNGCTILDKSEEYILRYNGKTYVSKYKGEDLDYKWVPTLKLSNKTVDVSVGEAGEEERKEKTNSKAYTYENDVENKLLFCDGLFIEEKYIKKLPSFETMQINNVEQILLEDAEKNMYEISDLEKKNAIFEELQLITLSKEREENWVNTTEQSDEGKETTIYITLQGEPLVLKIGWYRKEDDNNEEFYTPNIRWDDSSPKVWTMSQEMKDIFEDAKKNGKIVNILP